MSNAKSLQVTFAELGAPDMVVASTGDATHRVARKGGLLGVWSAWTDATDTYYPYGALRYRRVKWYASALDRLRGRYAGLIVEVER